MTMFSNKTSTFLEICFEVSGGYSVDGTIQITVIAHEIECTTQKKKRKRSTVQNIKFGSIFFSFLFFGQKFQFSQAYDLTFNFYDDYGTQETVKCKK